MRMRNEFPIREIVQREHIKVRIDEKQRSAFNLTTKPRNKYKCLTSQVSIFTGLSLCTITNFITYEYFFLSCHGDGCYYVTCTLSCL